VEQFDFFPLDIVVMIICCVALIWVIPRIIGEKRVIFLSKDGLKIYTEGARTLKSLKQQARQEIIFVANMRWGNFQPIGDINETRLGKIKRIFVDEERQLLHIITNKGLAHVLPASVVSSCIEYDMPRAILLLEAPCDVLATLMSERHTNTLVYTDNARAEFYANGALPEEDTPYRWQPSASSATPPS
jgi:hypothetical protein